MSKTFRIDKKFEAAPYSCIKVGGYPYLKKAQKVKSVRFKPLIQFTNLHGNNIKFFFTCVI